MSQDRTIESLQWAHYLGAQGIKTLTVDGNELALLPNGMSLESLEEFKTAPARIRDIREFVVLDSFAEYVNDFAIPATKLFGSIKNRRVTAVLDYHEIDSPSWATHSAYLNSLYTPEWEALRNLDSLFMNQTATAEWLEAWSHIVMKPDPAAMVEVAMNLQGAVNGTFAASVNRSNGSFNFSYQEDTVTNGVTVPTEATFRVAPFWYSAPQEVKAFIRFKMQDRKPVFKIEIPNLARIEYEALIAMFADVEKKLGRSVLVGP